jgi:hypothetical protein
VSDDVLTRYYDTCLPGILGGGGAEFDPVRGVSTLAALGWETFTSRRAARQAEIKKLEESSGMELIEL